MSMTQSTTAPLPDYQCAAHRRMAPLWRFLDDIYQGSEAWVTRSPDGTIAPNAKTQNYLPRFSKEHSKDYQARLIRTPYSDRFASALRDFVGLIFHNDLRFSENFAPVISEHLSNLDQSGSSAVVLLSQMALAAMRRGHTFAMIDCPNYTQRQPTLADSQTIRPYWVHVEAPQVLSWRSQVLNGKRVLTQVVIRNVELVADGAFGEREETFYLVLTPGRYDTYTIAVDPNDKSKRRAVYHPDRSGVHGIVRNGAIVPFGFIPLVCFYGGLQTGFFESLPPLKTLADLNLTHYQLYSDHLTKIHSCCYPQAVAPGLDDEDITLGPGTVLRPPLGGAFLWVEPSAGSIAQSRLEIEALEVSMDFLGTQYLVKPSDRQAAMVSMVQAAKVESSLELFARAFEQGINEAIAIHAAYLGVSEAGTVRLDTKFFQQSNSDPNLLQSYLNMFDRLLALPPAARRPMLEIAKRRGYLPDIDVEAMLQTLPLQVSQTYAP